MPNLMDAISRLSPLRGSHPTPISGTRYMGMQDFTAWQAYGEPTGHTHKNLDYIAMNGEWVKRGNYPAELQKLIQTGWKAVAAPTDPRKDTNPLLARTRVASPTAAPSMAPNNPLRAGFKSPNGFQALCNNWDHITEFEQVAAYSFRGDTRPPESILAAGGFNPPSQRTDDFYRSAVAVQFCAYLERKTGEKFTDAEKTKLIAEVQRYMSSQSADTKLFAEYHFWRTVLDRQQMHLASMTRDSFLKAYISTTRDPQKAADAGSGALGGVGVQQASFGWVYCLRIKSGFLLKQGVGGVHQSEGEIAHLGPLDWSNVYGFMNRKPGERVIYLRSGFERKDEKAFKLALRSFTSIGGGQ